MLWSLGFFVNLHETKAKCNVNFYANTPAKYSIPFDTFLAL